MVKPLLGNNLVQRSPFQYRVQVFNEMVPLFYLSLVKARRNCRRLLSILHVQFLLTQFNFLQGFSLLQFLMVRVDMVVVVDIIRS